MSETHLVTLTPCQHQSQLTHLFHILSKFITSNHLIIPIQIPEFVSEFKM